MYSAEIAPVLPPFLTDWSWAELLAAWSEFVTNFKAHYPDEPESNMPAAFDALVVLTLTVTLAEVAWEKVQNDIPRRHAQAGPARAAYCSDISRTAWYQAAP